MDMINLKIDSFHKAMTILDSGWADKAISLIAPDEDRCIQRGDHHLLLRFDDAERELPDWTAPTRENVQTALNFPIRAGENVLIHCTAGKSRSTAIALGVLMPWMTPSEALAHVCSIRPLVIPNRLIVRFCDELLDLGGELIQVVDDHYTMLNETIPMELITRGRHEID